MTKVKFDVVDFVIAYEGGECSTEYILEGFAYLIKTGQAWSLQGHYGRTASALIERGLIDNQGVINWDLFEDLKNG
jgi:hypothetical protein